MYFWQHCQAKVRQFFFWISFHTETHLTGKLWNLPNCDPSSCPRWQSVEQATTLWSLFKYAEVQNIFSSSAPFWMRLNHETFHGLCLNEKMTVEQRSADKEHKTSERASPKIENANKLKLELLYWLKAVCYIQEASCVFLLVGSLRHPCLRCLRPWSLAVKEGTAALIMALCAGRICCCSVSENSCEKP